MVSAQRNHLSVERCEVETGGLALSCKGSFKLVLARFLTKTGNQSLRGSSAYEAQFLG